MKSNIYLTFRETIRSWRDYCLRVPSYHCSAWCWGDFFMFSSSLCRLLSFALWSLQFHFVYIFVPNINWNKNWATIMVSYFLFEPGAFCFLDAWIHNMIQMWGWFGPSWDNIFWQPITVFLTTLTSLLYKYIYMNHNFGWLPSLFLAPTGALIVIVCYYTSAGKPLFEISIISANIYSFFSFWELNADW